MAAIVHVPVSEASQRYRILTNASFFSVEDGTSLLYANIPSKLGMQLLSPCSSFVIKEINRS